MKSFLITGSSGFVGANLIKYILSNALGNSKGLNLRNPLPDQLPDSDVIIHLAGKAHDLKKTAHEQEYFDVNYGKTKELFDLFLKSKANDFIYFSSVKAVADTVDGILEEDVIPNPQTPYGKSKLQAEEYILSKHLPEGKRIFILRPCMIHGPGNKGNLNLLYKVVEKGIPYPLGAFKNERSFLSIANLLFILERIVTDPSINGGVFNIADDGALATTEVIEIIGEAANGKTRVWNISPTLISKLASLGDKFHLPLNSERLKKLTESYIVSNKKIKKALNIEKLPVSSKEGLLTTIKSFRIK